MKSERLLSLDILRGITIVGMILVNNPGTWESIYAPLRHAEWNGLTPTDLVFPFFMFIMGVSMSFALSRFDHHFSRGFIIKLVRRTVILFLLGLFLSWFSLVCTGVEQPFSHIRILGVLQRLALAYFFGSLLIVGVRRPANLAWISGIILAGYSILLALGHGFELSEQNNPGTWESIYAPLRHAEWNGLTPTDLVFPFFMFIMGVSMSFALSRFDHHFSRGFIIKLVRRTVILFLLGLFLSWFSLVCTGVEQPFSHIRILGVLQRLALAYFFGSLLIVGVRRPANLAWISGIILAGYSILLALGHGFELSEQNIIAVTDRTLFGEAHLYREWLPDGGRIFFDPEGLLSTLPCIAQVIIGYFCGNILREKTEIHHRLLQISILGIALLFTGWLLSYGCPLNKKVWSPTFVLVTCGFASLLLVFLTWLIDIRKKQKWGYPFHVFGTNPLFIYIVAGVLATLLEVITVGESSLQEKIYTSIWSVLPDAHLASLIYGLLFIGFNYLIVWGLYKKQLFIKI